MLLSVSIFYKMYGLRSYFITVVVCMVKVVVIFILEYPGGQKNVFDGCYGYVSDRSARSIFSPGERAGVEKGGAGNIVSRAFRKRERSIRAVDTTFV